MKPARLIIAVAMLAFPAAARSAPFDTPQFLQASANGSRTLFATTEPLVPADTDSDYDIYQRFRGRTTLISTSPFNGGGCCFLDAHFDGASADGRRVFFSTFQRLVPADTDYSSDIYERFRGRTTLISSGQINGNGADDAHLNHVSTDGSKVLFTTTEQLVPADTNCCDNLYQHSGGRTSLVANGPGNGFLTSYAGASADGRVVLFGTAESLVPADTDSNFDLYSEANGYTTLVSQGQINGNGAYDAYFAGASAGASRVFFRTTEPLVPADTDSGYDIYQRFRGRTSLISEGPTGGNGDFFPVFFRASADGSRVIFETTERLVPADTDSAYDVYRRAFGTTTLLSGGQINGNGGADAFADAVSSDGRRVYFSTTERLVPADTDSALDEYERFRGHTKLITVGLNPDALFPFHFEGVTADGRRAFFVTDSSLVPADTGDGYDLYERSGGQTKLITTPSAP